AGPRGRANPGAPGTPRPAPGAEGATGQDAGQAQIQGVVGTDPHECREPASPGRGTGARRPARAGHAPYGGPQMSKTPEPVATPGTHTKTADEGSLLETILAEARPRSEVERGNIRGYLERFLEELVEPQTIQADAERQINTMIAAIDEKLSGQLNEVL